MRKYHDIQKQRDRLRELNREAYQDCPCRDEPLGYYSISVCNDRHKVYRDEYMRVFGECVRLGFNYYETEL